MPRMPKVDVRKAQTLTGHKDSLFVIVQINDEVLLSSGADGMVVRWHLREQDKGKVVAKVESSVYAMEMSDSSLIVGENFSGLHVIDLESQKELASLEMKNKAAFFDIKTVGEHYWCATGAGELLVVSRDMQYIHQSRLSEKSARCICEIPSRGEVAIGFSDHTIKVLSTKDFQVKWQIDAHQNSVFALALSPDGKFLLSGSRDAHLKVWNTDNYELYESIVAHMYAINHIDFSPNGQYFVTCSMDKSVKVWDASSFKLLKVIDKARHAGHGTSVNKLQWMTDSIVASCSDDRTVSVWEVDIKEDQ
ncbi:MAG: WD40 repeat domain-containing protein [Bacteroidota bacterium]